MDEVYGLELNVNSGNREADQDMCNADGSALLEGENIDFQLIEADFSGEFMTVMKEKLH